MSQLIMLFSNNKCRSKLERKLTHSKKIFLEELRIYIIQDNKLKAGHMNIVKTEALRSIVRRIQNMELVRQLIPY